MGCYGNGKTILDIKNFLNFKDGFFCYYAKGDAMKISKIINNNIISSLDARNQEVIIMGRGLGFGQKIGSDVDETKIEKVFRMDSFGDTRQFENLLNDVPIEIVKLVTDIINNAKKKISDPLQNSIYLTLIDHINYVRERQKQNIQFHNPLLYDIRRMYKLEYKIGEEAVAQINQTLGTDMPKDEAASIALHFINARLGKELPETINIAKIVQNIIKIVQYSFNLDINEDSSETEYFLASVKFCAQRAVGGDMLPPQDNSIEQLIRSRYQKSYSCVTKIAEYIKKEYHIEITSGEMTDLTVQIERIRNG